MSSSLHFTDVTLRDGLQMEATVLSVDDKFALLSALVDCGYPRLEITSFVSPKWVPQFSDASALCRRLFLSPLAEKAEWMAFVPNEKGLERLLEFPLGWAGAFVAASESFNRKNVNASIAESLQTVSAVVARARKHGVRVRIYLSTVFGCPYEGRIAPAALERMFAQLAKLNPDEIALGDTIGVAVPAQVRTVIEQLQKYFPLEKTALHFHNTYGLAMACAQAGYDLGVRKFDGSTGGIGGCPYAKGASGNAATEELMYAFFRQGAWPDFPGESLQKVYAWLQSKQITLRSHLHEIWSKGGDWRLDV